MPALTLRISDEQHQQLREWVFESQRSINREIIFRLFGDGKKEEEAEPDPNQLTFEERMKLAGRR